MKNKNFIETVIDSIANEILKTIDPIVKDIQKNYVSNWCIGSGSNFVIYENLSLLEAYKIYNNLNVRIEFGKRIYKKTYGTATIESYYCMLSNSGHTEIFIFEVDINKNKKAVKKQ